MENPAFRNGPSKMAVAETVIATYMTHALACNTIDFAVIKYGSDVTSNFLNESQGGYENVEEIVSMDTPKLQTIHNHVYSLKSNPNGDGDIIDGIVVAQDILIRVNEKKKCNRVLLIVTDGNTEVDTDGVEDLDVILQKMRDDGFIILVAVVGESVVSESFNATREANLKLYENIAMFTGGKCGVMRDVTEGAAFLSADIGQIYQCHIQSVIKAMPKKPPNVVVKLMENGKINGAEGERLCNILYKIKVCSYQLSVGVNMLTNHCRNSRITAKIWT